MSFKSFGQSEPEPEPEPIPEEPVSRARLRYLLIFASVVALILGGGSAAFLLLNSGPSAHRSLPNPNTPPLDGNPASDRPADPASTPPTPPTASPTASPSPSPNHDPNHDPGAGPKPTDVTPVTYRVPNNDLCALVNLTQINNLSTPPGNPSVVSQHKDVVDSGSVLYTCTGISGTVNIRVEATIFPSTAAAQGSYQESRTAAPASSEPVGGVGSQAFGYIWNGTGYFLMATADNMKLKMLLIAASGGPAPGALRDAAISSAHDTVPRLH